MTHEYRHIPVLLDECMEALNLHDGTVYLDCTLGGAGHSLEAASRIAPSGTLIGVDQDDMALEAAAQRLGTVPLDSEPILLKGNFGDLDDLLLEARVPGIDAVLFDLGDSWGAPCCVCITAPSPESAGAVALGWTDVSGTAAGAVPESRAGALRGAAPNNVMGS